MGWYFAVIFICTALVLGLWLLLLATEGSLRRGLTALENEQRHIVNALPPPPFDRLVPPGTGKRIPWLQDTSGPLPLALWHDPGPLNKPGSTIVIATHPNDRAYPETALLLSVEWEEAADTRTIQQANELVKRLYLEGRTLETGQVWQGYQILATDPSLTESQLPDDLPRTAADGAYEAVTRILLLHRYTIVIFKRSGDSAKLEEYLTLSRGLSERLNLRLGPPPSAFAR